MTMPAAWHSFCTRFPLRRCCSRREEEDEALHTEIVEAAEEAGTEIVYLEEDLSLLFGTGTLQVFEPVGASSDNEASVSFCFHLEIMTH